MLKRKVNNYIVVILLTILLGTIIYIGFKYINVKKEYETVLTRIEQSKYNLDKSTAEVNAKNKQYEICLSQPFIDSEITNTILLKKQEIDSLINNNNYSVSVVYEDLTTNYSYTYKPTKVYYGASLIKLVDAIYLINQASKNIIDLDDEKILYESKYKRLYSSGMEKRSIGENVSLRDLITYAISVSDNTAHIMLIDYIGFDQLKKYGKSLGAKNILVGKDLFGSQSAEDTNLYLKEAYRLIKDNDEYGPFLKNIMDNNWNNAFNNDKFKIYHKYGNYENYFHDIGLNLSENPYVESI